MIDIESIFWTEVTRHTPPRVREKFRERRELKIFRAFLRRAFNKARTLYDSDENVGMPDGSSHR